MIIKYKEIDFRVLGKFYELNGEKCRSILKIERIQCESNLRILAVMMNPGGSRSKGGSLTTDGYCSAEPDKTQYQLMELMCRIDIKTIDVINLLDIREPNSKSLYRRIKNYNEVVRYSIFCEERINELNGAIKGKTAVICAWGVDSRLRKFSELALSKIVAYPRVGKRKGLKGNKFYHPLPRAKRSEWVDVISDKLRELINSGIQAIPFA